MVYLKACPRCRGDLVVERDHRDQFIICLQCGHILTPAEESALLLRTRSWTRLTTPRPPHLD
jgi:uncharacterized protein YbaR (Trm112 family)